MNSPNFSVVVDVSEARSGAREAILVDVLPERLNPGDVSRLAADLLAAIDVVNGLAPPLAIST